MNTARRLLDDPEAHEGDPLRDHEVGPGTLDGDGDGGISHAPEVAEAPRRALPRIRLDAFVASPALVSAVEGLARDRRASKSEIVLHPGGFDDAIARFRQENAGDLIVIEDSGSAEELEWRIEALADYCPSNTRLLVIGTRNDIVLYRRLLKIGVSDYLVAPVSTLMLLDSVVSIFTEEEDARELGQVIAVLGVRGGTGASTVAHNAAAILHRDTDAVTLLIDADIGFGTAALQFDMTPSLGLAEALNERDDLDLQKLEKITAWRDKRFGILAAPDRPDRTPTPDAGAMSLVIEQARRLARHVVLDLPHGWSPATVEALIAADHVILVATPDLPSLRNSRTMIELIQRIRPNDPPPRLVLNRMPARGKPPVSQENFAKVLERPVDAVIAHDDAAMGAEMTGKVLAETAPSGPVVKSVETLVAAFSGGARNVQPAASGQSFLSRLFARTPR